MVQNSLKPTKSLFFALSIATALVNNHCGNKRQTESYKDVPTPPASQVPQGQNAERDSLNCPALDVHFSGGCLRIALTNLQDQSLQAGPMLFYEWYQGRDPEKDDIVIINGGPGGNLTAYASTGSVLLKLRQDYNILFYDQRGTGRSSEVKFASPNPGALVNYHTNDNVSDIEFLRKQVIRREKIILLGHSYGAHLAISYAAQYPQHVIKTLAFNGASDNLGFLLQPERHRLVLQSVLASLNQADLAAFYSLLAANAIFDESRQLIGEEQFFDQVNNLLPSFKGQKSEVLNLFRYLIDTNRSAIQTYLSQHPEIAQAAALTNAASSYVRRRFTNLNGGAANINATINSHIVCHDFLAPDARNDQFGISLTSPRSFFMANCSGTKVYDSQQKQLFDVKDQLKQINAPILLIGATHDPLIPLEVQKRDFTLLRNAQKDVHLLTMADTGHYVFIENPSCTYYAIQDFLDDRIVGAELGCDDL